MKPKIVSFVALAVVLAAIFIRLGFWQLDRLAQRRAANENVRQSLAMPAVPVASLEHAAERSNRHVVVEGVPDYGHEFVHKGRSRNGSPGVHVFTPIKTGESTAVLVNRGWVYAPDAATVDLARWREQRNAFRGYTRTLANGNPSGVKGLRSLIAVPVQRPFPYAVDSLYVVSQDSATERTPARLPEPDLTNGPHLSYAIQWFCFAAIAVIGAGIVLARSRTVRAG